MNDNQIRTPCMAELTNAQRRRAECLTLVRVLFPMCDSLVSQRIAMWLATGRW